MRNFLKLFGYTGILQLAWKLIFLFVLMGPWAHAYAQTLEEKPFVVLIPSYNNRDWYEYNLGSALSQQYHNFRIIYVDDASTDGTGDLVEAYVREWDTEQRVTLIHNPKRLGALYNTHRGVWLCQPDEIVAILDGDDWFAHEHVLEKLNQAYSDPDVWASYGQFCYYPHRSPGWARQLPDEIIRNNQIRRYDWVTTHLRTFYASLFHKIELRDLQHEGRFFTTAGDLAYTWPIMEMAGSHSRFIPDVLYIYNVASPLNDEKVNFNLQRYFTQVIRSKKPYNPLKER